MDVFLLIKISFWTFVVLLGSAAVFDLWKFIIPNWISLALLGLFAAVAVFLPVKIDLLSHLGAMALMLVGTLLLYRLNWLGGGDLKLLTVVALWAGLEGLPTMVLSITIAGAALSLGLVALRRMIAGVLVLQTVPECITKVPLPRLLVPGEYIPYGVAIAAGGIWLARGLPHLGLFA